jgi:cytochrome c biogenesis protein CcdA
MHTLISYLVAIAALDSLNPTAVALQIYLLSTPKPLARSIAFVVGVFFAYWVCGTLGILGLGQLIGTVAKFNLLLSESYIYAIQLLIGIVLAIAGLMLGTAKPAKRPRELTVSRTFLMGLAVTIWEFPTALPYLVAIEQIAKAKLDLLAKIVILTLYNLVFVLPLLSLVVIYSLFHQQSAVLLHRINHSIAVWAPQILRLLMLGLGVLLIIDSIAYRFGQPFLKFS